MLYVNLFLYVFNLLIDGLVLLFNFKVVSETLIELPVLLGYF